MTVTIPGVDGEDWQRGDRDAPVTIVEYGDFECPDVQAAYPVLKELEREMKNGLRLVYRHLPLTNLHPHSLDAARAAEAAGAQGRFWEMHDALFEMGGGLSEPELRACAVAAGADAGNFRQAFESNDSYEAVFADVEGIRRTGITGVPALFINGAHYEGPAELGALLDAVAQAGG